jgi:pimeloyl-ACP methyl ester carboxylesterase
MGRTAAPPSVASADDVLDTLLRFADAVTDGAAVLAAGHSAGAYLAQGIARRRPERVAALALVCPLVPGIRDVPEHRPIVADDALGDDESRTYFVLQTPEMLDRYELFVAPAIRIADTPAMARIGARWELGATDVPAYGKPTLVVAGRRDSTVGYAAATDLLDHYPEATLAVLDGAGHALPHEQPDLLACLIADWLARAARG